jgi:hypothetical protein
MTFINYELFKFCFYQSLSDLIKTILAFLGVFIYTLSLGFCQASTSFSRLLPISGM